MAARHQRVPSHEALLKVAKQHKLPAPAEAAAAGAAGATPPLANGRPPAAAAAPSPPASPAPDGAALARQAAAHSVYGELWASRKARVQAASPHGRQPGWDLRCVIVKSGDDCRQELMAMQLIRAFHDVSGRPSSPSGCGPTRSWSPPTAPRSSR